MEDGRKGEEKSQGSRHNQNAPPPLGPPDQTVFRPLPPFFQIMLYYDLCSPSGSIATTRKELMRRGLRLRLRSSRPWSLAGRVVVDIVLSLIVMSKDAYLAWEAFPFRAVACLKFGDHSADPQSI